MCVCLKEKQGEFMSPEDDETSREVFVLINKVNIASKTKKLRAGISKSNTIAWIENMERFIDSLIYLC